MRRRDRALWVALLTTCGLTACGGEPLSPDGIAGHAAVIDAQSAVRERLAQLTHDVALALGSDAALRGRVKEALTTSRFPEGKLEFSAVLRDDALALADGIAGAEARSATAVRAMVDSMPALEFYMPVREQRPWSGSRDMVVASALDERSLVAAFDLSGKPVIVDEANYHDRPLLVLVPVETDFSEHRSSRMGEGQPGA